MTVLVAIPYYGAGTLVDEAVRCALAQETRETVVVLVVGDSQEPPVTVRNSRLVVGTFGNHRGAPFTQQAMILGSPFEWYAPHGSDDWTDPNHISSLLALKHSAAGSSRIWYHEGDKVTQLRSRRTWIEFGCFQTAVLRMLGGYNPAEPCGQDSVLTGVLVNTVRVWLTTEPTYHKRYRADSLTHAPATKQGSPLREAVKVRNREVIRGCERIGWRHHNRIGRYRDSLVPDALRGELADRAAEVAKWLA